MASLRSGMEVESDLVTMTMTTDGIEWVVRVLVIVYNGRAIYSAKGYIKSGEGFSKERAQTELAAIDGVAASHWANQSPSPSGAPD